MSQADLYAALAKEVDAAAAVNLNTAFAKEIDAAAEDRWLIFLSQTPSVLSQSPLAVAPVPSALSQVPSALSQSPLAVEPVASHTPLTVASRYQVHIEAAAAASRED